MGREGGRTIDLKAKHCEIFYVIAGTSFRWKWRHVCKDGSVEESGESYELFYECVSAARKFGYEPQIKCS